MGNKPHVFATCLCSPFAPIALQLRRSRCIAAWRKKGFEAAVATYAWVWVSECRSTKTKIFKTNLQSELTARLASHSLSHPNGQPIKLHYICQQSWACTNYNFPCNNMLLFLIKELSKYLKGFTRLHLYRNDSLQTAQVKSFSFICTLMCLSEPIFCENDFLYTSQLYIFLFMH